MSFSPHRKQNAWSTIQNEFLTRVHDIVAKSKVAWKSRFLENKKVGSVSEVSRIVSSTLNDPQWQRELHSLFVELGGVQSPKLWDLYFLAYDKTVLFSDGYLDMVSHAHRIIPGQGTILDLGCGTGNISAALLLGEPKRKMFGLDQSPQGLEIARQKLQEVARVRGGVSEVRELDLKKLAWVKASLSGAVMNNVLYTLPDKERKKVLKETFRLLKPGGVLFLNDPSTGMQSSSADVEKFLTQIMIDSHLNRSPMTEFDVALLAFTNQQVLIGNTPKWLNSREISDLVLETGFQILERGTSYYGKTTFLSLRRPIPARGASRSQTRYPQT